MDVNVVPRKAALGPSVVKKSGADVGGHKRTTVQKKKGPDFINYSFPPTEPVSKGSSSDKIDCTKKIRGSEIDYDTVDFVTKTWDRILLIPDWSRVAGESFTRHIFRIDPATITLFGFPADTKWDDPALSENKEFTRKGIKLIKAIDMAVSFLGPDLEPLEEELYKLGWGHIAMKALPSHWPIVGEALMCVFHDCLVNGLTDSERKAWIKIYNFMGYYMIQGLTDHYAKRGEMWKVEGKSKPDEGMEPVPVLEESDDRREKIVRQLARKNSYRKQLQCTKRVPASSISYAMVENVIKSWQFITANPNWEKTAGDLFLRYIFKIEPGTIDLFGFPPDTDYNDPDLTKNMKFTTKGVVLIKAIDTAVQLLGPDLYPLEEVLYDLGKRHVIMKAQPEFWPLVGEALFLVFEEIMGDAFRGDVRESWTVMYNFLGFHMIQGLKYQYHQMDKKE